MTDFNIIFEESAAAAPEERWFGYYNDFNHPRMIYIPSVKDTLGGRTKPRNVAFDVIDIYTFLDKTYLATKIFINSDLFIINPVYSNYWQEIINHQKDTKELDVNFFIEIITKIIIKSYEIKDYQNFVNSLTKKETEALKMIINEIGSEGDVVISQLVNKSELSRPVFINTIAKLQEKNMAAADSRGVKGTHLKIDKELLKII